ncbi:response regulator transcription factor [Photobacterium damselae subsp. damselae]|uniref:Response regulator transcription factor n=1 Tax=Photobacterium damselae subsp. damselae TaxID=85581 RepID=A0A850QMM0_PHODD|nr:response regulator transcription factor [Photobacterium damselae]MBA5681895.1 response regulator transcription factor [Photobacterium damselae subsp. damselae]NVH50498.1 response regulator transcription factor [Photobacterium damselae subsp. damselae]NVO81011.1 response regulator transcription factor [Photobacterium damselae subsp. damselae]NVP00877.1 response regulator transcription factor [Photobacterium damselae subsp. damselae]TLS82667.1 response regulator transcription factor [Photobac
MSVKDKRILLIGLNNMHTELIISQLTKNNMNEVCFKSASHLSLDNQNSKFHLTLVDYQTLKPDSQAMIFLTNPTPKMPILLFNVTNEIPIDTLLTWPQVKGFLSPTASIEHLTKSIDVILDQGLWFPRHTLELMLEHYRSHKDLNRYHAQQPAIPLLTRREKQILSLLTDGKSNMEIAEKLFVAETTVKSHVYNLYKKLDVKCRKEAIYRVTQLKQLEAV